MSVEIDQAVIAQRNADIALFTQIKMEADSATALIVRNNAETANYRQRALAAALAAEGILSGGVGGGTPSPTEDDILNSDGTVSLTKWEAVANNYWNALDYRYGKKSADIAGLPTYSKIATSSSFPNQPDRKYQLGTYQASNPNWILPGGDFSSNIEHILYAPDNPAARIGLTEIQATSFSNATGTLFPEKHWNLYGGGAPDAVDPLFWKNNGYPNLGKVTCMGQALGRPGWATKSLAGTLDGWIVTIGANTMTNKAITRLAPGRIPTAITVFSSCEFALVTYWDTNTKTAGIATIALCGLGDGRTLADPRPNPAGTPDGWWGEWEEIRYGLHNLGNIAGMKVVDNMSLGNMLAPTAISCTTGHHRYHYLNGNEVNGTTGNTGNWKLSEPQRQRWMPGGDYANRYAKQGVAVVISKSEKMAKVIDYRKLFAYYNSKYFNADRNEFLKTTNIGEAADQWPYTSDYAPEQKPEIVKTIYFDERPTAVYVFNYCGDTKTEHRQFHIALEGGDMVTYTTGGYAQPAPGNYNPTTLGNPANIVEVGRKFIGRNTTSIQPTKEKGGTSAGLIRDVTRGLLTWSREEKAARWWDLGESGYNPVELRKCRMTQIQDGVMLCDTDNHGTESYVAMLADPTGRCVHHIVWGGTWFHTYSGEVFPLLNNEPFNYGGNFPVDGAPYAVMGANIS